MVGSFMVIYFTEGAVFWSTIDNWIGTFLIFIVAMLQIICFSWIFGIDKGWQTAHEGARIKIPPVFKFIMKYVTPLYLIVVLVAFCIANLPQWITQVTEEPMAQLALLLIAAVTAFLVVCLRIGEKRWRAAGLDLDGKEPLV
jgi:hypothetical protein